MISQAFIFAAGRGERMRPLTDITPKPLLKVNNKAIIDYTIEKLDRISSIKKIIINGFYLAEQVEAHIKNLNNPKIIFSREFEKIETGGGLVFAGDKIDRSKPLLTMNGDVFWQDHQGNCDIEKMINFWEQNDFDILLGLKKSSDYAGYELNEAGGDFILEGKNLLKIPGKIMTHAFVGLQIVNPKILEKAPEKCFSMSNFYKSALQQNGYLSRVGGVELAGKYFHIGTPAAIDLTEKLLSI